MSLTSSLWHEGGANIILNKRRKREADRQNKVQMSTKMAANKFINLYVCLVQVSLD